MNKFDKYIKEKENIVLQNLSIIAISIIIIIWALFIYQQIFCLLSNFYDINYLPKTITLEFSITTTGAIIAFWYGYKKYERDKEIEIINNIINFPEDEEFEVRIRRWYTSLLIKEKGYMDSNLYEIIDSHCGSNFIGDILNSRNVTEIEYKISKTLLIFNKHKNIITYFNELKDMWQSDENKTFQMEEFVRVILILEENKYEK